MQQYRYFMPSAEEGHLEARQLAGIYSRGKKQKNARENIPLRANTAVECMLIWHKILACVEVSLILVKWNGNLEAVWRSCGNIVCNVMGATSISLFWQEIAAASWDSRFLFKPNKKVKSFYCICAFIVILYFILVN